MIQIPLNKLKDDLSRYLRLAEKEDIIITRHGVPAGILIGFEDPEAWWDRRVMYVLDMTERNGELFVPEIDIFVNDLSLPLWAAVPTRAAARIAIESAETLDTRLEGYPPALLEAIYAYNKRWVVRALHRGEHLDEVDAALNG